MFMFVWYTILYYTLLNKQNGEDCQQITSRPIFTWFDEDKIISDTHLYIVTHP